MTVHNYVHHYAAGFIQTIALAMQQAAAQGLGGGSDAAEKTAYQALAATLKTILSGAGTAASPGPGFTITQTGNQITLTSNNGAFTLQLTFTAN